MSTYVLVLLKATTFACNFADLLFFECVFVMIQVAILLQKLNVPEKQHTYIAANVVKKFFQQIKKEYKLQSTQNCFLVVL